MRILIVDDDDVFGHLLAEKLQSLEPGFQVMSVSSAAAARQAAPVSSFDAFLLDRRLDGSDVDGITLMQELFQHNTESDAVILTAHDDLESGLRAFEAGAYRYLTKPFDTRELVSILKVIEKTQTFRREGNWLRVLSEVAADAQKATTVAGVGDVLCQGAQRLGFERARLWKVVIETGVGESLSDDTNVVIEARVGETLSDDTKVEGVSEAGHDDLKGFRGLSLKLRDLPYSKRVLASGAAGFFTGRPEPSGLDLHFGAAFKPPVGEWAKLPLFVDKHCIGFLVLDNAEHEKSFNSEQRRLLGLFGHQAAAALARALQQEETQLLLEIGREITKQAAVSKLDDLLDTVRGQVGRVMSVDNFMVALLDEDSNYLDFRLQFEEGEKYSRHWRPNPSCLCGDVIKHNEPLLLPKGGEEYRSRHNMPLCGRPSRSWLGVPLRIEGKAIGAIAVQDYVQEGKYGKREQRLLLAVADQVAGAIWMSYQAERDAKNATYQDSHAALRNDLRRLVEGNEYWFWHAVLTLITHRDGLSFNRATLFWLDETGEHMQGRMGIGYFGCQETRSAWEADEDTGWSFEEYLRKPHLARQKPTPLQQIVASWNLATGDSKSPCAQAREQGRRLVMPSADLRGCLPNELLNPPDLQANAASFDCALVPVKSDDRVLGLLVVDNFVDGEPLRPSDLDELEFLLVEAVQVWLRAAETSQLLHLGEAYQKVLALSWRIMGQAASRPAKESMDDLCRQAQALTQADCVVIYPYLAHVAGYDLDLVRHVGLKQEKVFQAKTKNKPRQQGVTFSILRSGPLVVSDVPQSDLYFGGRRLAEHDFLEREKIKALIGVPMREAATGEPLGVIFLDYRSIQTFTEQDLARAEHIGNIGASVTSYIRAMGRESQGRATAEAKEQLQRRAMSALSNIQALALSPDSDETKVIDTVLQNTTELFSEPVKVILAMLAWETLGEKAQRIRQDYQLSRIKRPEATRISSIYRGRIGKVIRRAAEQPESPPAYLSGSALVRVIRLGNQLVGAIQVQKLQELHTFDAAEQDIVEQLATVAALALENVQTREHMRTLLGAVSAVVDPRGLKDTLQAVVDAARQVAPDIDCVTLWYQDSDQEADTLVPGPQWGVRTENHRRENPSTSKLVHNVMRSEKPLFEPVANDVECLRGDFITDEKIVSVAAFPLRFGTKPQAFGVLFLNYRKAHKFTASEHTLFPTFANVAATAIHDARALEQATQGETRLNAALKVVNAVGTELDLNKVLQQVLTALKKHFDKPDAEVQPFVMLYDEEDNVLYLPAVAKDFAPVDNEDFKDRLRLPLDGSKKGIVCRVARESLELGRVHTKRFSNIRDDKDYLPFNSRTVSLLCAGLTKQKRLWGILAVSSPTEKAFDEHSEKLMELAAQQALIAMERAEQAAKLRFKDAVSSVTTWAAELAHDINREVGAIRSRAYWLRDSEGGLSDQGLRWVQEIDAGAARLVDVTRSVRSDQQRDIQAFDLCQMLSGRINDLVTRRWPRIRIVTEFHAPEVWLTSYSERLWRGVRHVVRNAADAMKEDGVLTIRTKERGDKIEIQIEDTGPGVTSELRTILLERPYTSKGVLQDRGYGLLIARQLIESLGGQLRILPQEAGRGAVFALTLPLTPERLS